MRTMLLLFLSTIALVTSSDSENSYQYINDGIPRTWEEAEVYCLSEYGSDLATIRSNDDLLSANAIIPNDQSTPWIGLYSDLIWRENERPYFFAFMSDEICPSECNGIFSGACVCSDLWEEGEPLPCYIGSRCTRITPDKRKINNDIPCNDALESFLCDPPANITGECDPDDAENHPTSSPVESATASTYDFDFNITIFEEIDFNITIFEEICCPNDDKSQCGKKNIYIIFYYDRVDQVAYKKAAFTARDQIKASNIQYVDLPGYNPQTDCVILYPFTTEQDFKDSWKDASTFGTKTIRRAFYFGHANIGKKNSWEEGLLMKGPTKKDSDDSYLNKGEMARLEILPWQDNAKMYIQSCYSGVKMGRGWSPASEFAKRQGICIRGELGAATFSLKFLKWEEIPNVEKEIMQQKTVYLNAYRRTDNVRKGGPNNNFLIPKIWENPPTKQNALSETINRINDNPMKDNKVGKWYDRLNDMQFLLLNGAVSVISCLLVIAVCLTCYCLFEKCNNTKYEIVEDQDVDSKI